jgi:hypothetical protein
VLVPTRALLDGLIVDAVAHAVAGPFDGQLDGANIALFTTTLVPTEDSIWTDLQEPTYAAYAQLPITWGTVYGRLDGAYAVDTQLATFQIAGTDPPQTITGWAIVRPGGTPVLLALENFPAPINLNAPWQALKMVGQFASGQPDFGNVTIIL